MHVALYWHQLSDGSLKCFLCPHYCHFTKDGQVGLCHARFRKDDQIIAATYGRVSSLHVDPMEKKPLYHYLPGRDILSLGTIGCNLRCTFCQNWPISRADIESAEQLPLITPEMIVEKALKLKTPAVAFTYNEPIIFFEYTIDTARLCHEKGLKTVAVTAGYISLEARKEFFSYIDAANVDLKSFSKDFYKKICGVKLDVILDNLLYIKNETNVWLELTTLIIPGENDSVEELEKLTHWIKDNLGPDVPLHFSAFHPDYKMLDHPSTPLNTLVKAREIALKNGLRYVFTGNLYDPAGANTYCHNCGKAVIKRDGFSVIENNIVQNNECKFCHTPCKGVF